MRPMAAKILSSQQIKRVEAYTIERNSLTALDLMERAARVCTEAFLPHLSGQSTVHVFCGSGNNGGDGLAIARMLNEMGFDMKVHCVFFGKPTPECLANKDRFPQAGELTIEASVTRALRQLDASVSLAWVTDTVALHEEHEVLRARDRTVLARPADVKGHFAGQLRRIVPAKAATAPAAPPTAAIRGIPTDDPYSF